MTPGLEVLAVPVVAALVAVAACIAALHGFAWSPEGTRVAVTVGAGISGLPADAEGDPALARNAG